MVLLRQLHAACGCEVTPPPDDGDRARIDKEGCRVYVEGLKIALDCDECHAFTSQEIKPDIISVQRCSGVRRWLILEMKTKMREHAAEQARAALARLGHDPMFPMQHHEVRIFFIIKNRRTSDSRIMRKFKTIEAGGWTVAPRLRPSGTTVECPAEGQG